MEMEITYKGKSNSLFGNYCKLENNVSTNINEYEGMVNLFSSLGFYSYATVNKKRETYTCTKDNIIYNIMIDNIENIK